jgi:hypothetical protein
VDFIGKSMLSMIDETGWHPGIGDPTVAGWITVAGYFVAAAICWKRARGEENYSVWLLFTIGLVFLGINKQLDLQTWFTQVGKEVARTGGWYAYRRIVQFIFLLTISLLAILTAIYLWKKMRKGGRLIALFGAVFLSSFVVVRAASFHHVDQMLGARIGELKINWLLEWTGIVLIIVGASIQDRAVGGKFHRSVGKEIA